MFEALQILINIYFLLFFIGLGGVLVLKKELLVVLVCLELSMGSLSYILLISSFFFDHLVIQLYVLSLLVVSACEAAIGLALFINYYKLNGTLELDYLSYIKA